jgi:hypothetical protein
VHQRYLLLGNLPIVSQQPDSEVGVCDQTVSVLQDRVSQDFQFATRRRDVDILAMNETQVGYPVPDIHPSRHQSLMQRTPGMNCTDLVLANNVYQATGNFLVPADTGPIRQDPFIHMQVLSKNWMRVVTVYFMCVFAGFLNDHQEVPWF